MKRGREYYAESASYRRPHKRARAVVAPPKRVLHPVREDSGEFKSVDVSANLAADTTSAVQLLNGIARGDEINERTGREVMMRSIQLNVLFKSTIATGVDQQQRLLIVYDRQTNATACTMAQVVSAVSLLSPRNLENRRRFKILFDELVVISQTVAAEEGNQKIKRFYRRLRHPVTFNSGDAGTVADITTGSLYAIAYGSEAAGVTAGTITINSRIRYQDK